MVNVQAKERMGILDCLNHPWFKNEKLDEKLISKIINKQKIKKQKNIGEATDIDPNIIKPKKNLIKERRLVINPNLRSTSSNIKGHNLISPRDNNFPPIHENKGSRLNSQSKGIILISFIIKNNNCCWVFFFKLNYFKKVKRFI